MLFNEPVLKLVPLKKIELQENPDNVRLAFLTKELLRNKILKDPPIVIDDNFGNLLQIDGTTRLSALKRIGCSHAVVQHVDYKNTQQVSIKSWMHVSKVDEDLLISGIKRLKGVECKDYSLDSASIPKVNSSSVVRIIFRNGKGLNVTSNSELIDRVALIQEVVDFYSELISRDYQISIENKEQLDSFFENHKKMNVALMFPSFSAEQIFELLKKGKRLPQGLTQHIIKGRVLGINYPLKMLDEKVKLSEKKAYFDEFLNKITLRYYEEPTLIVE